MAKNDDQRSIEVLRQKVEAVEASKSEGQKLISELKQKLLTAEQSTADYAAKESGYLQQHAADEQTIARFESEIVEMKSSIEAIRVKAEQSSTESQLLRSQKTEVESKCERLSSENGVSTRSGNVSAQKLHPDRG